MQLVKPLLKAFPTVDGHRRDHGFGWGRTSGQHDIKQAMVTAMQMQSDFGQLLKPTAEYPGEGRFAHAGGGTGAIKVSTPTSNRPRQGS